MNPRYRDIKSMRKGLFFSTIVLLSLIFMTSIWLQNTIFNTKTFTDLTSQAFSQQSSRESIGELVANRVFEDKPVLKSLLSERLSGIVAGILATEPAQNSIIKVARESQMLFTSPVRDPVVIQLSGLKSIIISAQEATGRTTDGVRLNPDDIPDEVMLIDTARLPNFHSSSLTVLWVGYLSMVILVAIVIWWLYEGGKAELPKRTRFVAFAVFVAAVVAIITGPLVEPAFVSVGRDAASQTLLRNIYESFIGPFRNQALFAGGVASTVIFMTVLWERLFRAYSVKISFVKNSPTKR